MSSNNTSTHTDNEESEQIKNITLYFNNLNNFDVADVFCRDNLRMISNLDIFSPLHVYICYIESLNHLTWKALVTDTDVLNYYLGIEEMSSEDNYTETVKANREKIIFVQKTNGGYYTFDGLHPNKQERIARLGYYIYNMLEDLRNTSTTYQYIDSSVNDDQEAGVAGSNKNVPNIKIIIFISNSITGIIESTKIHSFLLDSNEEENNTLVIYTSKNTCSIISENYSNLYQARYPTSMSYSNI
ncbi:hypothetical protein CWI37_0183p0040 [Hamiltosporidium tvaerminnensis]|uniref:Uncharacterized protein n=1 Tax=Hamiltosporidium tvaerminnensis TaxID=1176355 RepID=A0A4Q9L9X7_9MICR|nr:hypothetical protein CWI37_0183p0040 [Hamiltosporidium tvaerminnensis]